MPPLRRRVHQRITLNLFERWPKISITTLVITVENRRLSNTPKVAAPLAGYIRANGRAPLVRFVVDSSWSLNTVRAESCRSLRQTDVVLGR